MFRQKFGERICELESKTSQPQKTQTRWGR